MTHQWLTKTNQDVLITPELTELALGCAISEGRSIYECLPEEDKMPTPGLVLLERIDKFEHPNIFKRLNPVVALSFIASVHKFRRNRCEWVFHGASGAPSSLRAKCRALAGYMRAVGHEFYVSAGQVIVDYLDIVEALTVELTSSVVAKTFAEFIDIDIRDDFTYWVQALHSIDLVECLFDCVSEGKISAIPGNIVSRISAFMANNQPNFIRHKEYILAYLFSELPLHTGFRNYAWHSMIKYFILTSAFGYVNRIRTYLRRISAGKDSGHDPQNN